MATVTAIQYVGAEPIKFEGLSEDAAYILADALHRAGGFDVKVYK